MAESIFGATWWPLHVAVAWMLTRDRAFVERSNRAGKSLLSIAIALAMDKVDGKPTERYFKNSTDARSALREEIAAGNVRSSGTPFQRVADLQGHAVVTNEMARELPAVEIASLRLWDDGDDKDCLVPEDWRVAHGSNRNNLRGYRNVRVFRDDVLRVYPEGATPYVPNWERLPEAVKRVVATGLNDPKWFADTIGAAVPGRASVLPPKQQAIQQAHDALWPKGPPIGTPKKTIYDAIRSKLKQRPIQVGASTISLTADDKTIRKALRAK